MTFEPTDSPPPATPHPGPWHIRDAVHSPTLGAFLPAFLKAQSKFMAAAKDAKNPHFNTKYADLSSVMGACAPALREEGIAIFQPVGMGSMDCVSVTTLLYHCASGEYMGCALALKAAQATPQGMGSAITYARRYTLASLAGILAEDDDGNAASAPPTRSNPRPPATQPPAAPAQPAPTAAPPAPPAPVTLTPEQRAKSAIAAIRQRDGKEAGDKAIAAIKSAFVGTDGKVLITAQAEYIAALERALKPITAGS